MVKVLENKIRVLLLQAGADPSLRGYDYLITGIKLCYEDRNLLCYVTKELYGEVGKKYKVKAENVERCMRNTIENMKRTNCKWFQKEIIGMIEDKNKLTNSQFIALCVEILKIQEAEYVK